MKKGDQLVILADDAHFYEDFKQFCYLADVTLLQVTHGGDPSTAFQAYLVELSR